LAANKYVTTQSHTSLRRFDADDTIIQSENLLVAEDFETLGFEGEERSHTSMANITFNSDVVGVVLKYLDEHIVTHIDVVSEESTFDRREMSKIDVARALAPSLTQTKILKAAADRSTNAPRLILEFLNCLVVLFPHVNVAEHVVRELAPVLLSCESDEKSRKPDTNTNIDKEIETLTKALAWRCVHKLAFPLAIGEKKNILKAGAATAQSRCGNTGGEGLDRAVYFLNTCAAFFFDDIDSS